MGTLSIISPATVVSVSNRSNYDGINPSPTIPGFSGPTIAYPIPGVFTPNAPFSSIDQSLINGIISDGNYNGIYWSVTEVGLAITRQITFGFDQNTPVFSLDGQPAINFNSLPSGFRILTLNLSFGMIATVPAIFANVDYLAQVNGINMVNSPSTTPNTTFTYSYPVPLNASDFISKNIFLQFHTTNVVLGSSGLFYRNWSLTGTYDILRFISWTLIPANPRTSIGDTIRITSIGPGGGGLDLSHISSLNIRFSDSANNPQVINIPAASFTTLTPFLIIFIMPNFDGAYNVIVEGIGDGTQFSGSVSLGQLLTINFTDGTGIYKLSIGKPNDTLYVQGSSPLQTVSTKIPDPFIKTGFLP